VGVWPHSSEDDFKETHDVGAIFTGAGGSSKTGWADETVYSGYNRFLREYCPLSKNNAHNDMQPPRTSSSAGSVTDVCSATWWWLNGARPRHSTAHMSASESGLNKMLQNACSQHVLCNSYAYSTTASDCQLYMAGDDDLAGKFDEWRVDDLNYRLFVRA